MINIKLNKKEFEELTYMLHMFIGEGWKYPPNYNEAMISVFRKIREIDPKFYKDDVGFFTYSEEFEEAVG